VALFCLPAGVLVLFLPESSRRELEEISGETTGSDGG